MMRLLRQVVGPWIRWMSLLVSWMILGGCVGEGASRPVRPAVLPSGCNPLSPQNECLLPYPSDVFLSDDVSMPSGKRVRLPPASLQDATGFAPLPDPLAFHPADGFSHAPTLLALFPSGVDPNGLVFHTGDILASLAPESSTVLLEASPLAPVLHFAELDPHATSEAGRALILRPLVRLKNQTRYIVAIQGLRDPAGQPVEPPERFRCLRDAGRGQSATDNVLSAWYETEIFPALERFGIRREGLQLAWDFTTESEEQVSRDLLAIRQDLLQRFEGEPPRVEIRSVREESGNGFARRLEGLVEVPLYVDSEKPGALLNRDAQGAVVAQGVARVPFSLYLPPTALQKGPDRAASRIIQYGHGFFGQRQECASLGRFFEALGAACLGMDWWGLSSEDLGSVFSALGSRPEQMVGFTDRLHQAMANLLTLSFAVRKTFPTLPALRAGERPILSTEQLYFYGNSLGHILGGTYVALSPFIDRVALGVGGAGFGFLMSRSRNFIPFLEMLRAAHPDALDMQKLLALLQTTLDRVDPITYASHVREDPYPGGVISRNVLMHMGIGDADVPNLASHLHARSLGLPLLIPYPKEIPALGSAESKDAGSALVAFDFGIDPLPAITAKASPRANPVHDNLRFLNAVTHQIDVFFRPDGRLEATCVGPCDPE